MCKLVTGLLTKLCQLISGRVNYLNEKKIELGHLLGQSDQVD